jgi:hypothetical protein
MVYTQYQLERELTVGQYIFIILVMSSHNCRKGFTVSYLHAVGYIVIKSSRTKQKITYHFVDADFRLSK